MKTRLNYPVISGAFLFIFFMGLSLIGKSQNTNESSSKELQKPEKSIGISAETPQEIHAPTLLLDEIVREVPSRYVIVTEQSEEKLELPIIDKKEVAKEEEE